MERVWKYICLDNEKKAQKAKEKEEKRLSKRKGMLADRGRETFWNYNPEPKVDPTFW